MPGLHVYRSNLMERLADQLGELIAEPLKNPLQAEIVVVQSMGMRRWLSLEIARRHAVSMNCEFPFPASLAHEIFRSAFPDVPEASAFTRDALPWRVFSTLPRLLPLPGFAALQRYVGNSEVSALKQFQLSAQIASVFDRYLAHCPAQLIEWQLDEEEQDWQARLWRELARDHAQTHPPALLRRFLDRIASGETALPNLPERLSLFGISNLPPYYIDLIGAAAKCVEVHLFLLEPTDQYWGDILASQEQDRLLRRHGRPGRTAADYHYEAGNELLASLGKPGRAFTRAVQDLEPVDAPELFDAPSRSTLLSRVQADIFELRDRSKPDEELPSEPEPVAAGDFSIQAHCCHGPMRELEILHDQLLNLFERLPGLTPKDILVTMPDVEVYAPFIEAVFDTPGDESLRIPFTIADRSAKTSCSVAQAFLQLLELHGGRFGAATVLSLLEAAPVRQRFGLSESDMETVRSRVEQAGIRWGIDGKHRAKFDLPEFEQNSWRAGLDRLLLGYALPGDGDQLFDGILPVSEMEGGLAETLGCLAEFVERLFRRIPQLGEPRSLPEWGAALAGLLTEFFDETDESVDEMRAIRSVFESLGELSAHHDGPVPFEIVRSHVSQALGDSESAAGFLSGRVTFCSLKPMRSIPFRVVCVIGLDDGAFPRRDATAAFAPLPAKAKSVGFSRRDDDRQLFLESILSARDVLYLSYSGLSTKDNSESPPSVVVSELLDYLDANFMPEPRETEDDEESKRPIREQLLTRHRLQPFSAAYFSGDRRLFSYSAENCRASRSVATGSGLTMSRIDGVLPEPEPEWLRVDLDELARFFCHPAKFFLQRRLGLRLPEDESPLDECEPLAIDTLAQWQLQQDLAERLLSGGDAAARMQVAKAAGLLPAGHMGEARFQEMASGLQGFVERVKGSLAGEALEPATLSLHLGDWQVNGTLADLYPSGRVCVTGWGVKPKDRLRAWVAHLALNAAEADGLPTETLLYGTDRCVRFGRVENAREVLLDLLEAYREGASRPLPFFPESSFDFARRTLRPGPRETADPLGSARGLWATKEAPDRYYDLCFGETEEPLDAAWQETAKRICGPMIEACTEEKLA